MKSVEEIYREMLDCFAQRTGMRPAEGCDLAARLYAVAAQVYSLYVQADWVERQCFPQSALGEALDRVYPLVQPLGVAWPELRLRRMKSQWGNCHWRQGYITLNTALARCPETLRDYVALHELVHFVHPDHGPGFYGLMDRLMPDWRQRRKELRRYGGALVG